MTDLTIGQRVKVNADVHSFAGLIGEVVAIYPNEYQVQLKNPPHKFASLVVFQRETGGDMTDFAIGTKVRVNAEVSAFGGWIGTVTAIYPGEYQVEFGDNPHKCRSSIIFTRSELSLDSPKVE